MKFKMILITGLLLLSLCSCGVSNTSVSTSPSTRYEEPHLYNKTVTATVLDIDVRVGYRGWRFVDMEIYNQEYNLTRTIHLDGSHAAVMSDCDEGDVVEVTLLSWVIDSTGEVVRRELHTDVRHKTD